MCVVATSPARHIPRRLPSWPQTIGGRTLAAEHHEDIPESERRPLPMGPPELIIVGIIAIAVIFGAKKLPE
ncbi:MAG: twin-arginine translocase TatA/TatE family subunit, partial [Actinomycetota bacterium]